MSKPSIPIQNVYVMMAYAFRAIQSDGFERIRGESFDHLHDLLAEILARSVGTQIRRGLHRDYHQQSEMLATVRGRIDVTRSVASRSMTKGHLICDFDEYEPDTLHNRVIKSVIILLLRRGNVDSARKAKLRLLLPYLEAVTLISPTAIQWSKLTYYRTNATYRMILGVCELIVRGLLPTPDDGIHALNSWISEERMSALYERFLREYYLFHHPGLAPRASKVPWDYDKERATGTEHLPSMVTDVTLRCDDRRLVIDAKYYTRSMNASRWGKLTVTSANLYQLLSYVKNLDKNRDGSVSGLLLYSRTDAPKQPSLDIVVQGNRIGVRTLDLNKPWEQLRAQLENIITDWLGR